MPQQEMLHLLLLGDIPDRLTRQRYKALVAQIAEDVAEHRHQTHVGWRPIDGARHPLQESQAPLFEISAEGQHTISVPHLGGQRFLATFGSPQQQLLWRGRCLWRRLIANRKRVLPNRKWRSRCRKPRELRLQQLDVVSLQPGIVRDQSEALCSSLRDQ